MFASRTEFGFTSTVRGVFIVVFELDDLITIFTGFGFETASLLMRLMIFLTEFKLTILTDYFSMCISVVFLFLTFGDYLSTSRALVIHSGAPHLMHSVLANFDLPPACAALLRWFITRFHFY